MSASGLSELTGSRAAVRAKAEEASAGLSVRKAVLCDARSLAALMGQLGYPTREDEMVVRLTDILPRDDYLVAVAVLKGHVVGAVTAMVGVYIEMNGRYGRVTALSVAEDHRGQGVGALLLAHAESWLGNRGGAACLINCSAHRADAHRFYEREGYQVTGFRFVKLLGGGQ